ncbi:MAG: hypothetical protein LBL90_08595 [Prevotellaceae bacterium]|jgi:hypothetical protein|nr:hypothetical protein [Prevotellaceae bacterium]
MLVNIRGHLIYRSEKDYSGFTTYSKILLSTRSNHIHELVHGIMLPLYPEAPLLLHEGIATYYGGGADKDYSYHVNNLKKYIVKNKINYSDLNKEIEGETSLNNIIGALIIEHTLKMHGYEKVLQLFNCIEYDSIFNELGIEKEGINNWLHDLINQHE